MYYKILNNQGVQAVTENPVFYKYLEKSNRFELVPIRLADSLRAPETGLIYSSNSKVPGAVPGTWTCIDLEEYNYLKAKLSSNSVVISSLLESVQQTKIAELSAKCHEAICKGIEIYLQGSYQKFTLTNEDQLNIARILRSLDTSSDYKIFYHSSGSRVCEFTSEEFRKLAYFADRHILYHTTYFNLLKHQILNTFEIATVLKVKYGQPLASPQDRAILDNLNN